LYVRRSGQLQIGLVAAEERGPGEVPAFAGEEKNSQDETI
jgi:hypothetical protein